MKLKDLEKVSKIYEDIKALDKDINKLHKLAQSVAVNESIVKLNMDITDLKFKDKINKSNIVDEHGDLINSGDGQYNKSSLVYDYITGTMKLASVPKPAYESTHTEDLSDVLTLELLGLLIKNKQESKQLLVSKLTKYKITI